MKNFLVVSNKEKDPENKVAGSIKEYLDVRECICSCRCVTHDNVSRDELEKAVDEGAECVLVLGGDGTLIQVAGALAGKDIPLLGINLGTLGYLAEIERDHIIPTLERLIEDRYDVEERMMLSVEAGGIRQEALNDMVITRLGDLRVVRYRLYVNGRCLTTYEADGIIVSTPTGSTGYNLSAGGPIVEPCASMMLVTPICPHTLNSRPVVLAAEDIVRIEVCESKYKHDHEAYVSCDGASPVSLSAGDAVDIRRSNGTTKIIKISKEGFLDILSRKLRTTG